MSPADKKRLRLALGRALAVVWHDRINHAAKIYPFRDDWVKVADQDPLVNELRWAIKLTSARAPRKAATPVRRKGRT